MMKWKIGLLFVLALTIQTSSQATDVSGNVSGTWTLAGSPYMVVGDITVPAAGTLQIMPGVQVRFTGHFRFDVAGVIQAVGTESELIIFTRDAPTEQAKWWGIRLYSGSSSSHLEYCVIEYVRKSDGSDADANGGGLALYQCTPTVSHCIIRHNWASRGGGIYFEYNPAAVATRCTFIDNEAFFGGGTFGDGTVNSCIFVNQRTTQGITIQSASGYCDLFGNTPPDMFLNTRQNANGDSCDAVFNIRLDPQFVESSGSDCRLQFGSPCVNAGDPSLSHDSDGSVADMGALGVQSRGLRVAVPDSGGIWSVGNSDTIRWIGAGFEGGIRIELNRDYPGGAWEVIAENTANDGSEPWVVTGPSSTHCRVRISTVSDTLSDISDADFSINAYLGLSAPNGAEEWGVFQTDTVRWNGGGFDAVRIELNRNYPSGAWEVVRDSTANDGIEAVYVTDPLSTHCRVRISAIGDTLSDISDGDFSITASQGYLGLVRTSAPSSPVLSWNAGSIECPQVGAESFRLKNFGSEAIVVFQPLEPLSSEFSRTTSCGTFLALSPGQMSACSLRLGFDPGSDGTYRDTLLVQTDAVNGVGGYVRIPLSGIQISTPAVPQVVIQPQGEDIHLAWQPITQSVGGCPVNVTRYLVFYAPTQAGPYYYHGYTSGTAYTHIGAVSYASGMFYQVIARTGETSVLEEIPGNGVLTMGEVMEALK